MSCKGIAPTTSASCPLPNPTERERSLATLPIHSLTGANLTVRDAASIEHEPGLLEMHREDLRQLVAVSARFEGIDMGHGMAAIQDATFQVGQPCRRRRPSNSAACTNSSRSRSGT